MVQMQNERNCSLASISVSLSLSLLSLLSPSSLSFFFSLSPSGPKVSDPLIILIIVELTVYQLFLNLYIDFDVVQSGPFAVEPLRSEPEVPSLGSPVRDGKVDDHGNDLGGVREGVGQDNLEGVSVHRTLEVEGRCPPILSAQCTQISCSYLD